MSSTRALFIAAVLFIASVSAASAALLSEQGNFIFTSYRSLVDSYRQKEGAFLVARAQYEKLGTLSSQEEVVQSARDTFLTRTDLLTTYIDLLNTTLSERQTVPVEKREVVAVLLASSSAQLRSHRERVDIATDRIKIDQEAKWFEDNEKAFSSIVDSAQALILIGRMEESLASLVEAKTRIDAFIASASITETLRTEKMRGSDELGRTITSVQSRITAAYDTYSKAENNRNREVSGDIGAQLSGGYDHLLRGVDFARELAL